MPERPDAAAPATGSSGPSGAAGSSTATSRWPRAARLLVGFVAVSVGAGVLSAAALAPAVVGAGAASNKTVAAFNSLPSDLETQPLSQQSKILYADGSTMATFYYENRIEVPLDQVAPVMQQAIVAIEDARYWSHGGVDARGIVRAVVNNAAGDDVQGASTLTQQWIKNVQVEKAVSALPSDATTAQRQAAFRSVTASTGVKGYTRKLREIKLAIAAQKKLSKKQILDNYLNITSFGDGQYGVQAASRHYFNLDAKDLPLQDAALLAGVVNNPIIYDPVNNPNAALTRRNLVLDRMLKQGLITPKAHDDAKAMTLAQQLSVQPINNGCTQAGNAAYFCDYVYRSLLGSTALGKDTDARRQRLFRGGLTITTTLDRAKQDEADAAAKNTVPADTNGVGAAVVTVEPGTGKVLAMAQNLNYSTSASHPVGTTSYNFNVDRSLGGYIGFQTGSTYKAFTLTNWLQSGHKLNDVINAPASPHYNIRTDFRSCERLTGTYDPGNSEGDEAGNISVLQATEDSVNTAFIEMARKLSLCDIRTTAESLGVHSANGSSLNATPASVLGTNYIAPLTMASAYAAFADDGTWCSPFGVAKVTDTKGTVLVNGTPSCAQKIDPDVANTVTDAFEHVITNGTGSGLGIAWPAAGKTGTTNFEVGDTWFVGYTKQLSTAVYVGTWKTDNEKFSDFPVKGVRKAKIYGATYAGPIWHDYMAQAMAGLPQVAFTAPTGALVGSAPAPAQTDSSSSSGSGRSSGGSGSTTRTSAPAASSAAPSTSAAPAPAPAADPAATTNP